MDHSESDRKGKIEVFWRENPLQIDIQMISKGKLDVEASSENNVELPCCTE